MNERLGSAENLDVLVEEHLEVSDPLSGHFYELYRDAFAPLAVLAAARHVVDEGEWREQMLDDRVLKLVAHRGDRAVGLATVALDIEAVPWVSASFYEQRHPGRQIYYTGVAAVEPAHQSSAVFEHLLRHGLLRALKDRAVCAFDCSSFVESNGFPAMINRVTSEISGGRFAPVDTQSYYEFDTVDADVIDLREPDTGHSTAGDGGSALPE